MTDPRPIPAGRRAEGRISPPPSKSETHRYLNLTLLAGGSCVIERPLQAEDTALFMAALEKFGFALRHDRDELRAERPDALPDEATIHCGNAGTMARFLTATLCVLRGEWRLEGDPRLRERPIGPLVETLRALGARIEYEQNDGHMPLRIHGGELSGGRVTLDAGESSQYLSALLMAATRAAGEVTVAVSRLRSGPYVDLTLDAMSRFGGVVERRDAVYRIRPQELAAERVRVEGDFSSAAYSAAAAVLSGGMVELEGLSRRSRQADRGILDLLESMGAKVATSGEIIRVRAGEGLSAISVDLGDMPDQVPTVAALAPFADGVTRIRGVPHLRLKESDRLAAMSGELRRAGAQVEELPDGLVVPGVWAHKRPPEGPVVIETHDDHRIAMSMALVGLRRPGLHISHPGVVEKSYPGFWRDLWTLLAL